MKLLQCAGRWWARLFGWRPIRRLSSDALLINHGGRSLADSSLLLRGPRVWRADRLGQRTLDISNFLDFASYFAHDAGTIDRLCSATAAKSQYTSSMILGNASLSLGHTREVLPLDNLADILLLVLLEAGERVAELLLALLQGPVVVLFVLFPYAIPLALVLRFVSLGFVFKGKVSFD